MFITASTLIIFVFFAGVVQGNLDIYFYQTEADFLAFRNYIAYHDHCEGTPSRCYNMGGLYLRSDIEDSITNEIYDAVYSDSDCKNLVKKVDVTECEQNTMFRMVSPPSNSAYTCVDSAFVDAWNKNFTYFSFVNPVLCQNRTWIRFDPEISGLNETLKLVRLNYTADLKNQVDFELKGVCDAAFREAHTNLTYMFEANQKYFVSQLESQRQFLANLSTNLSVMDSNQDPNQCYFWNYDLGYNISILVVCIINTILSFASFAMIATFVHEFKNRSDKNSESNT